MVLVILLLCQSPCRGDSRRHVAKRCRMLYRVSYAMPCLVPSPSCRSDMSMSDRIATRVAIVRRPQGGHERKPGRKQSSTRQPEPVQPGSAAPVRLQLRLQGKGVCCLGSALRRSRCICDRLSASCVLWWSQLPGAHLGIAAGSAAVFRTETQGSFGLWLRAQSRFQRMT